MRHGWHQEAQKSIRRSFDPTFDERETGVPFTSFSVKSGAFCPTATFFNAFTLILRSLII